MRAGFLALFGVVLAASLLELFLPGKEGSGVKKAFRALTALTVILMICAPFAAFFENFTAELPEIAAEEKREDYEAIFTRTVRAAAGAEFKLKLSEYLKAAWDVESCEIYLTFDGAGELSFLSVRLTGRSLLLDPAPIEADLAGKFGCATEVR